MNEKNPLPYSLMEQDWYHPVWQDPVNPGPVADAFQGSSAWVLCVPSGPHIISLQAKCKVFLPNFEEWLISPLTVQSNWDKDERRNEEQTMRMTDT